MNTSLIVLLGVIAAVTARDFKVGTEGGFKIFEQNVTANPTIWRRDDNFTVSVNDSIITMISVTDNRPEKDGEAKIVEGGIGHNNVTFELKSPAVFRGYYFTIEVFTSTEGQMPHITQTFSGGEEQQNGQVPQTNGNDQQIAQVPQVNGDGQNAQVPQLNGQDTQAIQFPGMNPQNVQVPESNVDGQQTVQGPQHVSQFPGNNQLTTPKPQLNGDGQIAQVPQLNQDGQLPQVPQPNGNGQQTVQPQLAEDKLVSTTESVSTTAAQIPEQGHHGHHQHTSIVPQNAQEQRKGQKEPLPYLNRN